MRVSLASWLSNTSSRSGSGAVSNDRFTESRICPKSASCLAFSAASSGLSDAIFANASFLEMSSFIRVKRPSTGSESGVRLADC